MSTTNYAVSMALLGSAVGDAQSLGWLKQTQATWGCLGLWNDEPAGSRVTLTIAGEYQSAATAAGLRGQRMPAGDFPPLCQLPRSVQDDQSLIILCPIRTQACEWGTLALRGWNGESLTAGTENLTIRRPCLGLRSIGTRS